MDAACRRGEKCLYLTFEESESQILRNMRSIGLNLEPHVKKGLLIFQASRPTLYGLETHLLSTYLLVEQQQPAIVVLDPVTDLISCGSRADVHAMIVRLLDHLKGQGVTTFLTDLTPGGATSERTQVDISSLIDTWILLRDIESGGERNRGLYVLKSRGMAHSNQIREFRLTNHGIELLDVYLGPGGVLTGAARQSQEAREEGEELARRQEVQRRLLETKAKRKAMEAQIAALQAKLDLHEQEMATAANQEEARLNQMEAEREAMAQRRRADAVPTEPLEHPTPTKKGGHK